MRLLMWRKAAILWITCLGGLIAALLANAQSRVYESRASLEIQTLNEDFLNLRDIYPTAASSIEAGLYPYTQTELMPQDSLLERVAEKLRLDRVPEFQPRSDLLSKLRQYVRIVPVKNSRIIEIICNAGNASLAADIANNVAQSFIAQSIETRRRAAQQTYETIRLQLQELGQELKQQEANVVGQSGSGRASGSLTPEAGPNHHAYDAMLQYANQARMASLADQSNIQLLAPAEPAARPFKPNLPLSFAFGTLGGLVLAIGFVLLQEQKVSALRSPGEAGTYLALSELGAIPDNGAWKRPQLVLLPSANPKVRVERALLEHRSSPLADAFRSTAASIFLSKGYHPHIIVITSSRPTEGTTTVVSNLGIGLAEIGCKVLLIDGNVRRPQLHKIFHESNAWGLSDFLCERDAVDELPPEVLVKKTAVPYLYLLPSGVPTDNMFRLLYSGRTSCPFRRFRDEFEYVLVDAPPCLNFVDARELARGAEGLVLVVRANYTDRRTVQTAVQRLEGDGTRVMGFILNRWDPSRCGYHSDPAFQRAPEATPNRLVNLAL